MAHQQDYDKIRKYLAVMGLSETDGLKELRDAYHRKASILHPDKRPGDAISTEAFKKVNVAYEHLKRHFRSAASAAAASTPAPPSDEKGITRPAAAEEPAPPRPAGISFEELVFRLKHSQNKYVRVHAIKGLEANGGKESAWAILPALDDIEEEVALCAAEALGLMGARIASLPLMNLHRKSSPAARARIEEALSRVGSPMAARYLSGISTSRRQTSSVRTNDLPNVTLEFHADRAKA